MLCNYTRLSMLGVTMRSFSPFRTGNHGTVSSAARVSCTLVPSALQSLIPESVAAENTAMGGTIFRALRTAALRHVLAVSAYLSNFEVVSTYLATMPNPCQNCDKEQGKNMNICVLRYGYSTLDWKTGCPGCWSSFRRD
ncbi:hypothetical protein BSKO_12775 [Bryopsis sp. KO-2023]|nr:hypothetical protein BSKO_12775 [Bryopsis sp. KO-2023]